MRIIHICQRDDPDTGGSLRVAEALACEQKAAGHEVWMLFLYGPPGAIAAELPGNTAYLGIASSRQALRGVFLLRRAIGRMRPDIIHSHDGITWPRLAYITTRAPVVMHTHLPISDDDSSFNWFLIRKTSDQLVGISLHTIETWVRAGFPPSRINYVPNGVDFRRFHRVDAPAKRALRQRLGLPQEKRILLWVGRLHRGMKGSDRVERIARLLPEDRVLVVVGNGPEYAGMLGRCHELVGQGRLVMAGSVSAPEDYYLAADEFLFTSYYEPFGLVILEAAASGLPIYAFPVVHGGGAVELLREFAAVALDDAASDTALRDLFSPSRNLGETSLANSEKALARYAWSRIAAQVEEVYWIALGKCRRTPS